MSIIGDTCKSVFLNMKRPCKPIYATVLAEDEVDLFFTKMLIL
jgi:hypothetical protein